MSHLQNIDRKLDLCFLGPMVGRNPGKVTTQGEILSDLFAQEGHRVVCSSGSRFRLVRWAEITKTVLREGKAADVVILQVFGGRSFLVEDTTSYLVRSLGIPLVMFLHGGAFPEFMQAYPRWSHNVLSRADLLVSPTTYLRNAVGKYGFHAEIVPNVVDLSCTPYTLRAGPLRPRLFWMRAFHPIYDPQTAIRAFVRVRSVHPGATLVMGGHDKGLQAPTESLARELGVRDAIQFVGFLDVPGKLREFAANDIFITTNRIDNMPVSVLEACASGLPVVSTNVGGIPDFITHEKNGLLVDVGDDAAMASAVNRLLAEPALAERLRANGKILADECSWPVVRAKWDKLFSRLKTPVANSFEAVS